LAPKTVRNVHGTLHRGLADGVRWGRVLRNVAEGAVLPKLAGVEMCTWTPREMNTFLEHVKGDRLFAAWLLLARSGVRRGELLGLHWKDVNLSRGSAAIRSTLTVVDHEVVLRPEVKSRKGRRVVPLESETVE
jgi:integrase